MCLANILIASLPLNQLQVNFNLWLTPDDAIIDPTTGGMVIFGKPTTGSETFSEVQSEAFGKEFLRGTEKMNVTVPYKQNRAVIFPSTLWHMSDSAAFKPGHENRRINLTLLFGKGNFAGGVIS